MAATLEEVENWEKRGREMGAKYIISVCDSFDYTDYPVFCMTEKELEEKKPQYDGVNMQRINEVIEL